MSLCYIGLGSNLQNPLQQVTSAVAELAQSAHCELLGCSGWYRSTALGTAEQPDYVNGVACLQTHLAPLALLDLLQLIEAQHGRVRGEHWGPRTLDLDLLLYDNLQLDLPRLQIPHPHLQERNFVLYPLFELAPQLTLPCGTTLASLLARCPTEGLQPPIDVNQEG
jgi:2-amino-4-hydroxy-6-hydroxymethyldihydropteridine diphosphokinase